MLPALVSFEEMSVPPKNWRTAFEALLAGAVDYDDMQELLDHAIVAVEQAAEYSIEAVNARDVFYAALDHWNEFATFDGDVDADQRALLLASEVLDQSR
jgi:hypothetical protein